MQRGIFISHSSEETFQLGIELGASLLPNAVIALFGDLGTGKTTFIRGLASGIGGFNVKEVCSPTFTFMNIYQGHKIVFHFDLYRLPCEEEFFAAGFDEYFKADGICCIEWAEKIESILPSNTIHVRLSHLTERSRQIDVRYTKGS